MGTHLRNVKKKKWQWMSMVKQRSALGDICRNAQAVVLCGKGRGRTKSAVGSAAVGQTSETRWKG